MNEETILLEDVCIGYVYLFAGQSNMQFKLRESNTSSDQWNTESMLRLFSTDRIEANEVFSSKDGWLPCHQDTAGDWSAIAYLTGMNIVKRNSVPVGAIACYQGASVIESWVPSHLFADHGIDIPISEKHIDHTHPNYASWNGNGTLYQYALAQVIPFSLSGIIWYQGESDTSAAEGTVYAEELCLLIDQWRKDFQDPTLSFVIIQIADFLSRSDEGWRMIQNAQKNAVSRREHVYMIPCADICENDCIHPPTKNLLADRIADLLSCTM